MTPKDRSPRDNEFSANGFYAPGVFHLEIATREDLNNFDELAQNPVHAWTVSTFLHEYIHFLQDTTSTHGLINFISYVQHLKNAIKQIRENPEAEFATPIVISNAYEFQTNAKLRRIYYGDGSLAERISYENYEAKYVDLTMDNGQQIRVPKYHVRYWDIGAHSQAVCHFGSGHIKEYMAHAIQNQFVPNTLHSDIPYRIVELIINKEFPPLATDPSLIVALCDAALMHYHPAHLFFDAVERMKGCKWIPDGVESVYEFALDGLKLEWGDRTHTFDSLFRETALSAINEFRDAGQADIFNANVQWFELVMEGALDLRLKQRGFFGKLVVSPGELSQLFYQLFDELGVPFMTNALAKGYFHPPKRLLVDLNIQPYLPKVFHSVLKTFEGESKCRMFRICEARPDKTIIDQNCLNSPWKKVNQPLLCPYAQIWKAWGLDGKTPVPCR